MAGADPCDSAVLGFGSEIQDTDFTIGESEIIAEFGTTIDTTGCGGYTYSVSPEYTSPALKVNS